MKRNETEAKEGIVDLVMDARGGNGYAMEELCKRYAGLAEKTATEFLKKIAYSPSVTLDDLVQEAYIGLIEAVDKFDPEKGCAYSEYFKYGMEIAIRRYLTLSARLVRIPKHMLEKIRKVEKAILMLSSEDEDVDLPAIAEYTGFSEKVVKNAMEVRLGQVPLSLDGSQCDEDASYVDFVLNEEFESKMEMTWDLESLYLALEKLSDDERALIFSLYGMNGVPKMTLSEVSTALSMSRSSVSNKLRKIKDEIRRSFVA